MKISSACQARRVSVALTAALLGAAMLAATPSQAGTRETSASAPCSIVQKPTWASIGNLKTGTGIQYLRLFGVSAASSTHAWAVGGSSLTGNSFTPVTYRWNGTKWKAVPIAPTGSDSILLSVADLGSGNAWAVGNASDAGAPPLIEHWNGNSWQTVPSPLTTTGPGGVTVSIGAMRSVSAVRARDVWAIADGFEPGANRGFEVTEHWDGSAWSVVRVVESLSGDTIQAVGPNDIWESEGTGLAHYDGSSWQTVKSDVSVFGVSSDEDIWTQIASSEPPAFSVWDGHSWNPGPGLNHDAVALAPFSPTDAWALATGLNPSRTGVEIGPAHWDGAAWQVPDLNAITPTLRNRIVEAITTVPGTDSVWVVGYSGGSPLRPMFLLAGC